MRYYCVVLVLLGMPLTAAAQRHQRPAQPPPTAIGNIGLGLPSIGLPVPVNYPKPWEWTVPAPAWERPRVPAWEQKGPPAWERGHAGRPVQPTQPIYNPGKPGRGRDRDHDKGRRDRIVYVPYVGYGYGYGAPYPMSPATGPGYPPEPAPQQPVSDTGFLRIEVEPASQLQIFVDGVFVGTPADYSNGELEIRSGAHRIELRAPGYETQMFDVRIEVDRGVTYRSQMKSIGGRPAPAAPPAAPIAVPTGNRTLYVIPGCYLGNVLPDVDRLPAGCDIARMKSHTPQ